MNNLRIEQTKQQKETLKAARRQEVIVIQRVVDFYNPKRIAK